MPLDKVKEEGQQGIDMLITQRSITEFLYYDIRFLYGIYRHKMIGLALVLPEDTDTTKLNVYENYNFAVMADISKQMLSVPDHHLMALVHVEGKETPNVEPQNDLMNVWEIKKEDLPGFFALTSEGKAIKYEDSDISDPSQVHPTVLLQWAETFWNTWDSENMQKLLDYHTETLLPQLTKNTKEWLDLDTKIF